MEKVTVALTSKTIWKLIGHKQNTGRPSAKWPNHREVICTLPQIINIVSKAKKTRNRKIANKFHILLLVQNNISHNINCLLEHKSRYILKSEHVWRVEEAEELKRNCRIMKITLNFTTKEYCFSSKSTLKGKHISSDQAPVS